MVWLGIVGGTGSIALPKGAAGQAVHNMRVKFGIEEVAGLWLVPVQP